MKNKSRSFSFISIAVFFQLVVLFSFVFAENLTLAPLNKDFSIYLQLLASGQSQQIKKQYKFGYMPSPVDFSHFKGQSIVRDRHRLGFATAYDLRTTGKLTTVKNQGDYGTCWAHATYASLESFLLPSETWDFSENNLVNKDGFDWAFDAGGNSVMSTAYFARWSGPVNETDDTYPNIGGSPSGLTVQKHVQEVLFLPDRDGSLDNSNIKQVIIDYGAVYTSMYYSDSYYNSTNKAYYYTGGSSSNHAVAIVGWDDDYDRTKFTSVPAGNGAFIVRNSWGTNWGENGYFYLSYYDSNIGKDNAIFNNAEATSNYSRIYQYDTLGLVANLGYGSTIAWFANIFTASSDEVLKAGGFYTSALDADYEIYIYKDSSSGPISGTLVYASTGTVAIPGYHTINLDSVTSLTAGHKFSLVVKLTTPGYNYPIPVEEPLTGYSSAATANTGESYVSSNGSSWTDITTYYDNTNVCLKAYTTSDLTAPSDIGQVNDGTDTDINWTSSATQLSANWTASSDAGSGIAKYWYAIGTTAGGTNTVDWTDNGTDTAVTRAGLSLIEGTTYYFTVKAENGVGLQSTPTNSNGQTVDYTPPATIATVNDGINTDTQYTTSISQLSANWTASSDAGSGIAKYWYAIGTVAGGTNTVDWTDNGADTAVTRAGLSLIEGTTYYFTVKAENQAGLQGTATNSNGQIVDSMVPTFSISLSTSTAKIENMIITVQANERLSPAPTVSIKQHGQGTGTLITMSSTDNMTWTGTYAVVSGYDGTASINITGVDLAGNIGTGTGSFKVDTTAPTVTLSISPSAPLKTGWFQVTATIADSSRIIQKPTLNYTPFGGSPVTVDLNGSDKNWSGSSYIESTMPEGTAVFSFSAFDELGNSGTTISSGDSFEIDTTVNISAGGTVSNSDNTTVTIPCGSCAEDINIKITAPDPDLVKLKEADNNVSEDAGLKTIKNMNLIREITATSDNSGNEIRNFNKSLTISIPYPDTDQDGIVDGTSIKESSLRMFYLDEILKKWVLIANSSVDSIRNMVSVEVNHFSTYVIMYLSPPAGLIDAFVYPNPFHINKDGYVRIANILLEAKDIKIYIYNLVGELIRTFEENNGIEIQTGSKICRWNGRNENNEVVASGIYIYMIKTGSGEIKTGKIALLR